MAPGFLLLLAIALLGGLAPVVVAVGVGCLFFQKSASLGAAMLKWGTIGALACALVLALLKINVGIQAGWSEVGLLVAAAFTCSASLPVALSLLLPNSHGGARSA
jgi:hypothetical protein